MQDVRNIQSSIDSFCDLLTVHYQYSSDLDGSELESLKRINDIFLVRARQLQNSINSYNRDKVVLFGKSGSGKTSLLNRILRSAVSTATSCDVADLGDSPRFTVLRDGVCLKDNYVGIEFKSAFIDQYSPASSKDYFLFPEGDTVETTRVCHLVNFGPQVRITLACDQKVKIQNNLERLRSAVRLQRLQDVRELAFLHALQNDGFESLSEQCPVYVILDKSSLQRPLAILGYDKTHDLSIIVDEDIKIPDGYEKYCDLSFRYTPSDPGPDNLAAIIKIRSFLTQIFSVGNPLWGILEHTRLELPLGFLKSFGEIVDTPGVEFLISDQSRYGFNTISQASTLLFLNDGRKIPCEIRQLICSTGLFSALSVWKLQIIWIYLDERSDQKLTEEKSKCREVAGFLQGSHDNISSFLRIEKLLLPSIQTIYHGVQDISRIIDAVLLTKSMLGTSNMPNSFVCDFLNLIKSFKKNLHNQFDLFQSWQHSDKICRISHGNEKDCTFTDLSSRITQVFDLMQTEIFSITRHEFCKSRNIMLYSGVTHILTKGDTCNTEVDDVEMSRIEEIILETLHITVQNVLSSLQGSSGKGELTMKSNYLNLEKRIEEVLLLKYSCENNKAMLSFCQSLLLHIQVFINSHLLGRETYHTVIQKGIQNILQVHNKNMNKSNMKPTDILHILHDSYVQGIKIFLREILQRVHNVSRDVTAYILTSPSKCIYALKISDKPLCNRVLEVRKILAIEEAVLVSCGKVLQRNEFSISQDPILQNEGKVWSNQDLRQLLDMLELHKTLNIKSNYELEVLHKIKDRLAIFENYDSSKALLELRCQILSIKNLFGSMLNGYDLANQLCAKSDAFHVDIDEKINYIGWSWQHMRLLLFILRKVANNMMPHFHVLNKWEVSVVLAAMEDEFDNYIGVKETSAKRICSDTIQKMIEICIQCWGGSNDGFIKAEKYFLCKNVLQICKIDAREKILLCELESIFTSLGDEEKFFREWASDILVSLHFFAQVSNGRIREFCRVSAQQLSLKWNCYHREIRKDMRCQDILFYNEGCYGSQYYAFHNMCTRKKILKKVTSWDLEDYFGINLCDHFQTSSIPRYDDLNSSLVWAFFFHGNGVHLQGSSSYEIYDFSESAGKLLVEDMVQDTSNFISECYFVTHKIFTRTAWCQYRVDPSEWSMEKNFLTFYVGRIIQLQDIELLGEFIQTLKCLGVKENNKVLKNALQFMMSKYDRQNGGWLTNTDTFESKYHATICAVGMRSLFNYYEESYGLNCFVHMIMKAL